MLQTTLISYKKENSKDQLSTLTTDIKENTFPSSSSNKELANIFADFFVEKVNKIRSEFQHD